MDAFTSLSSIMEGSEYFDMSESRTNLSLHDGALDTPVDEERYGAGTTTTFCTIA